MNLAAELEKPFWNPEANDMKIPEVDLSACIRCGVCVEVCPKVFKMNDAGFVAVADLVAYPERNVNEAIMCCPTDCIYWQKE